MFQLICECPPLIIHAPTIKVQVSIVNEPMEGSSIPIRNALLFHHNVAIPIREELNLFKFIRAYRDIIIELPYTYKG